MEPRYAFWQFVARSFVEIEVIRVTNYTWPKSCKYIAINYVRYLFSLTLQELQQCPICLDTISDMVELSCKHRCHMLSRVEQCEGSRFFLDYELGMVYYVLFFKECDIWGEGLWLYCIYHPLRYNSDEMWNPSPNELQKVSSSTKWDLRGMCFSLLFLLFESQVHEIWWINLNSWPNLNTF